MLKNGTDQQEQKKHRNKESKSPDLTKAYFIKSIIPIFYAYVALVLLYNTPILLNRIIEIKERYTLIAFFLSSTYDMCQFLYSMYTAHPKMLVVSIFVAMSIPLLSTALFFKIALFCLFFLLFFIWDKASRVSSVWDVVSIGTWLTKKFWLTG